MRKRRSFSRPIGTRRYRRLFIISTEGIHTEPQYFNIFNSENANIHIKCICRRRSDPISVLKNLKTYLSDVRLKDDDEAWIVVDIDNWEESQLRKLFDWSCSNEKYGLAVSNPNFEYWLLLHFEDGNTVSSSQNCKERLKRYLPEYKKNIACEKFIDKIKIAVVRAKRRDNPVCSYLPKMPGTTVYRLVEKISKI